MKTHIKSYLLIIFLLSIGCFLLSCNKSDNHSWEGRVLEYGSNKPVANATVYLVEKSSSGILGPVGSSTVDSITTGSDGKFKFKFIDGPVAHYLRGKAELYYETELSRNGNSPSKTKTDLILDPHAWLRIHVKSNNPENTTNAIHLDNHSFACKTGGFWGPLIDTTAVCQFKGGRNIDFRYRIATSVNGNENFTISQYLAPYDTTTILIEF